MKRPAASVRVSRFGIPGEVLGSGFAGLGACPVTYDLGRANRIRGMSLDRPMKSTKISGDNTSMPYMKLAGKSLIHRGYTRGRLPANEHQIRKRAAPPASARYEYLHFNYMGCFPRSGAGFAGRSECPDGRLDGWRER